MSDYSVAVLLITDGRPCLQQTLASAEEFLFPYVDGPTVLVSDTQHKLGLSGAIKNGWQSLWSFRDASHQRGSTPYIFHLEDDFTFREPVPVDDMARLCERENLTQVALRREAVPFDPPGGFLNTPNYEERDGWIECVDNHPGFFYGFTFNPCIYPFHAVDGFRNPAWQGEAGLTSCLRKLGGLRLGLYGSLTDPPRCFHANTPRSAGWKL